VKTDISATFVNLFLGLALVVVGGANEARAQDAILATSGTLRITTEDLRADFMRMPEQARNLASADINSVRQSVGNLMVRRAMAAEAERLKLDQSDQVQRQLALLRDRILSDAWLAVVDQKNEVTNEELERLAQKKYNEEAFTRFKEQTPIKVRHILFEKSDEGKKFANEILTKLRGGADFAENAQKYSKDPGSASRGGDLGKVSRGRMVPAFEEAAFALKQNGDLSEVIETGFGYHIIRIDEVSTERIVPFAEVKTGLIQEVASKIRTDARNAAAANMFKQVKLSEEAITGFAEAAKAASK
jgi:peptidyl-prolyl cis-trans isomerase C